MKHTPETIKMQLESLHEKRKVAEEKLAKVLSAVNKINTDIEQKEKMLTVLQEQQKINRRQK